jgi:hypothetical protein
VLHGRLRGGDWVPRGEVVFVEPGLEWLEELVGATGVLEVVGGVDERC